MPAAFGTEVRETPTQVVEWMGAMQAQDHAMCKWAVGVRLPGSTLRGVNDAIANADIIRTHVLRPTWHLVAAKDIHWMLSLTAPRIKSQLRAPLKMAEITNPVLSKTYRVFENALAQNKHLNRNELALKLNQAKILTNENRMTFLLLSAELDGLICSGKPMNGKHTYALLEERVKKPNEIPTSEALHRLAENYFRSRGPATLRDFAWWSGLAIRPAKQAIASLNSDLQVQKLNAREFYIHRSCEVNAAYKKSMQLLPAFDEYLISYKSRELMLNREHGGKLLTANGIFRPAIVNGGLVAGTWSVKSEDHLMKAVPAFFNADKKINHTGMKRGAKAFADFING